MADKRLEIGKNEKKENTPHSNLKTACATPNAPAESNVAGPKLYPRTGIEQPFLADPPQHIRNTVELERTNDISQMLRSAIIEDYRMRENSRIVNLAKVVYDVEKESPHYKNMAEFLDPQSQIRVTKQTVNGRPMDNLR